MNTYLYDAEPISTYKEAEELVEFYTQHEPRNQHRWIIILKESNVKIGTCGFHCLNKSCASVEIGYDLQPDYWRKGYISEALRIIIEFARNEMNVKTIIAKISSNNIASINAATKMGFCRTESTYIEEFHGKEYLHYIFQLYL